MDNDDEPVGRVLSRRQALAVLGLTGAGLTLAGAPFRFSGTNVYWLGLDDNVRDASGAPTYPSRFRVEDAFRAAQAAGGTVVRTWGGLVGCGRCIEPSRGTFQDSAFASLDYAVATAAFAAAPNQLSFIRFSARTWSPITASNVAALPARSVPA